ncbi:hypothetical protein BDW42DRAFT_189637 [Aspergillus taichungensis]|uniref:Uncharacterized protein n=1 Tax=Aspergillus taichungensis TaxID=482145 RepID=A0A2J5HDG9_9EURO|nr:hypothetical protein BDW42DRAFT_189637 [Aspergillus taichungensis]
MSDYPSADTPFKTIGFREICEVNGCTFERLKDTQTWTVKMGAPLMLSLVHEAQGEGEPNHWYLFVAEENERGFVYQVKGDAECMRYEPSGRKVNVLHSASFLTSYTLATITDERPPRANSRREVTENCQGWTVRMIARLVDIGIVPTEKLEMAKSMVEAI